MKGFSAPTFRNAAIGACIAFAAFFVIMTIVAMADLYIDLRGIGDKGLEARASLVGNMIGAVVSGLLAAAAALTVVYLERHYRREEEFQRRLKVVKPALEWITTEINGVESSITRLERWVFSSELTYPVPISFDTWVTSIVIGWLDSKVQHRVESDFLDTVTLFRQVDLSRSLIKADFEISLPAARETYLVENDRRPAARHFLTNLGQIRCFLHNINEIHKALTDDAELRRTKLLFDRIDALQTSIWDDLDAWDIEKRKIEELPSTT